MDQGDHAMRIKSLCVLNPSAKELNPWDVFYGTTFIDMEAEFAYQATKARRVQEGMKNGHALAFFRVKGMSDIEFPVLIELKALYGQVRMRV